MTWIIKIEVRAKKELSKLQKPLQKKLVDYLKKRVVNNPKEIGKALSHDKSGLGRYRVGDYRIICKIDNRVNTISVLAVGHRREVYK